jgi:cell division protein ZapA (FtsZ GTPase activity inhibitor)
MSIVDTEALDRIGQRLLGEAERIAEHATDVRQTEYRTQWNSPAADAGRLAIAGALTTLDDLVHALRATAHALQAHARHARQREHLAEVAMHAVDTAIGFVNPVHMFGRL